jgi:hypothetical protein
MSASGPAADAARLVLGRHLDVLLELAPANWPEVFSALRHNRPGRG